MNNKELILKRLLEEKHITIDELFILNNTKEHIDFFRQKPYWGYTYILSNYELETNNIPSDYKMD